MDFKMAITLVLDDFDFLKAQKKPYKIVCLIQKVWNGPILKISPTYNRPWIFSQKFDRNNFNSSPERACFYHVSDIKITVIWPSELEL